MQDTHVLVRDLAHSVAERDAAARERSEAAVQWDRAISERHAAIAAYDEVDRDDATATSAATAAWDAACTVRDTAAAARDAAALREQAAAERAATLQAELDQLRPAAVDPEQLHRSAAAPAAGIIAVAAAVTLPAAAAGSLSAAASQSLAAAAASPLGSGAAAGAAQKRRREPASAALRAAGRSAEAVATVPTTPGLAMAASAAPQRVKGRGVADPGLSLTARRLRRGVWCRAAAAGRVRSSATLRAARTGPGL